MTSPGCVPRARPSRLSRPRPQDRSSSDVASARLPSSVSYAFEEEEGGRTVLTAADIVLHRAGFIPNGGQVVVQRGEKLVLSARLDVRVDDKLDHSVLLEGTGDLREMIVDELTPVSRLTAVTDSSFGGRTRFTIAAPIPELHRTR